MLLPYRERKYACPIPGVTLRSPQAMIYVAFGDKRSNSSAPRDEVNRSQWQHCLVLIGKFLIELTPKYYEAVEVDQFDMNMGTSGGRLGIRGESAR